MAAVFRLVSCVPHFYCLFTLRSLYQFATFDLQLANVRGCHNFLSKIASCKQLCIVWDDDTFATFGLIFGSRMCPRNKWLIPAFNLAIVIKLIYTNRPLYLLLLPGHTWNYLNPIVVPSPRLDRLLAMYVSFCTFRSAHRLPLFASPIT